MFTVLASAVDSLLARKSLAVHDCLIDAELLPAEDGTRAQWGIVLRSRDKAVIGRTNNPDDCIYVLSGKDGAPVPFIVAQSDDAAEAEQCASELRAFYAAKPDASFSSRYNALSDNATELLPVAIALFGVEGRLDAKGKRRNGWAMGSYADVSSADAKAKAAAREEAIAQAAKALNNADALKAALERQTAGKAPAELLAMVQSLMAQIAGTPIPAATEPAQS